MRRPDGTLEHLGRIDTQLKLRGYRIEAGDVESHLLTAPGVSRVAVAIRIGAGGDERLVAFVVLEQAMMLDAMELRRHLRERVPVYMIPQHFIALDSLPLTENRKVDYKQLPQLTIVEAGAPIENELPKSANEKLVAQIWSDLLGVENISCADNFFERGGHSLLTIQVIVRLLEQTSIELAPQHFFNNSLSGIAAELDARGSTRLASDRRVAKKKKNGSGSMRATAVLTAPSLRRVHCWQHVGWSRLASILPKQEFPGCSGQLTEFPPIGRHETAL